MFINILGVIGAILIIVVFLPMILAWLTIMLALAIIMTIIIGTVAAFVYLSDQIRNVYHWFKSTAGVR